MTTKTHLGDKRARKRFGRAVAARHGKARQAKAEALASRNAYRNAAGLAPIPSPTNA